MMSSPNRRVVVAALAVVMLAGVPGCPESDPYENSDAYVPPPEIAEIFVTPHPDRLLVSRDGFLYAVDLSSHTAAHLTQIQFPSKIAFTNDGRRVLLCSTAQQTVYVLDLERQAFSPPGAISVTGEYDRLEVSVDDRLAILAHADGSMAFCDLSNGELVHSRSVPFGISDLGLSPDGRKVAVVGDVNGYYAGVYSVDLDTFSVQGVLVPMCTWDVSLTTDRNRVWLALPPRSSCGSRYTEEIVVLDLLNLTVEDRLPGGNPIVVTPDGQTIIGLAYVGYGDPEPPEGEGSYLVFVDPETLETQWQYLGEHDWSYRLSRDGRKVFAFQSIADWGFLMNFQMFDVETGEARIVEMPPGVFTEFVVTGDGRIGFFLTDHRAPVVYRVDFANGTVREMALGFEPKAIDLTLDDSRLIVTGPTGRDFHVVDTGNDQVTGQFTLPVISFP